MLNLARPLKEKLLWVSFRFPLTFRIPTLSYGLAVLSICWLFVMQQLAAVASIPPTHTHTRAQQPHTPVEFDKRHIELQLGAAWQIFRWREESQWDKLSPLEFVVSQDPISSASGPEFQRHTAAGVRRAPPLRREKIKDGVNHSGCAAGVSGFSEQQSPN